MPKRLEAGRLNRRITIQRPIKTQDADTGAIVTTWSDVATVAASIEPLSVNALITAQSLKSRITVRIVIRYRTGLTADMRFVADDGTIYKPEGFLPDAATNREYITCPCTAGA